MGVWPELALITHLLRALREMNKKRDRSLSWGEHDRQTQIRGVWGKSWAQHTSNR